MSDFLMLIQPGDTPSISEVNWGGEYMLRGGEQTSKGKRGSRVNTGWGGQREEGETWEALRNRRDGLGRVARTRRESRSGGATACSPWQLNVVWSCPLPLRSAAERAQNCPPAGKKTGHLSTSSDLCWLSVTPWAVDPIFPPGTSRVLCLRTGGKPQSP